jgi:hypothetical protein
MIIRRHLSWAVVLWLACQAATIVAAPFAACLQHSHSQTATGDPACPLHQHHSPSGTDGASLRCECQVQEAALASLMIGTGLLPVTASVSDTESARAVVGFEPTATSHIELPETQPPR